MAIFIAITAIITIVGGLGYAVFCLWEMLNDDN